MHSLLGSVVESQSKTPCAISLIEHQEDHGY